jgi:hypothetical protein
MSSWLAALSSTRWELLSESQPFFGNMNHFEPFFNLCFNWRSVRIWNWVWLLEPGLVVLKHDVVFKMISFPMSWSFLLKKSLCSINYSLCLFWYSRGIEFWPFW